jgi:flagella basal body P-ring formation protein FlgA
MKRIVYGLIGAIAATTALSAAPANHTISVEQISSAISDAGMPVLPQEVKLLTQVRATTDMPKLRVSSIQNSGDHSAIVRMECESPEQCLPFFVKTQTDRNNQSAAANTPMKQAPSRMPRGASKPTVMRAGSQAVLLLEGDRVHIRISVVSIENGAVGEKIRVRAVGNRQSYIAEVIDATSLKGML